MGAIAVELRDDLVSEQLQTGKDLLMVKPFDRKTECQLIHAHIAPCGDLLGHIVRTATQHVAASDETIEQLIGVNALDHVMK